MNRRELFKWLGGLAGAALLPKLPDISAEVEQLDPEPKLDWWLEWDGKQVTTRTNAEHWVYIAQDSKGGATYYPAPKPDYMD